MSTKTKPPISHTLILHAFIPGQIALSMHLRHTLLGQGLGVSQPLEDKVCREIAGFCNDEISFEEVQPLSKRNHLNEEEEEL